ncbi:thiamine pyrophosphate-dependent enzyme, partial [Cutibacterium acnes subsp. acnes]|nr:thiamine pyrophosphate-dependent enzyme [Cutibacterium acnes subsp. acnes]
EHMKPIHPEYVAHVLNEVADRDAIFTADTGMCNVWTARYIDPLGTRRLIGSFLHGSMANALPHAIGAQASHPGRQVISVSGDGGLSMLLGELVTARMLNLPIKVV